MMGEPATGAEIVQGEKVIQEPLVKMLSDPLVPHVVQ